jgi:hypothetical protein
MYLIFKSYTLKHEDIAKLKENDYKKTYREMVRLKD